MNISKILLVVVIVGVCVGIAELVAYGVKVLVLGALSKLRKRKRDRRIIRQAKAAGTWDKLNVLGGRALELRAWKDYKIKRKPGETDACLRQRITNAIANEYKEKIQKEIAAICQLPLEVIKAENSKRTGRDNDKH